MFPVAGHRNLAAIADHRHRSSKMAPHAGTTRQVISIRLPLNRPSVPLAANLTSIAPRAAAGASASATAAVPAREDTHRSASSSGRAVRDPAQQPCAFLPGIQLIVGPMFAGKTSELLRRAAELEVSCRWACAVPRHVMLEARHRAAECIHPLASVSIVQTRAAHRCKAAALPS